MVFSSITFLYYFLPVTAVLYFASPKKLKNIILLLASIVFYGWGEPKYVILMGLSVLLGYGFGLWVEKYREKKAGKILCISSVCISLSFLLYFKYADFFLKNFNAATGRSLPLLNFALPIGISFYTFQIISYTIDVYRGEAAQKNLIRLAVYVMMFPQLIAGPIIRYADIARQLSQREHSFGQAALGIRRFVIGLAKKILFSDQMGELCSAFLASEEKSVLFYWLYAIAFMLQIYFDFSGYSDMAIGLGRLFGFRFPENFNYPYISASITEFWRRWHISLGTWFRDYVYIPMGGNRKGKGRQFLHILVVWTLTGLWHGAAWKFVFWGAMHGAGLAVHKAARPWLGRLGDSWPVKALSWTVTMALVAALWVFFRADSWSDSWTVLGSLAGDYSPAKIAAFASARMLWLILMATIIVAHCLPTAFWDKAAAWFVRTPWLVKLLIFISVVQLVLELRGESVAPFIYFQF